MTLSQNARMTNAAALLEEAATIGATPPKTLTDLVQGHRLLKSTPKDTTDPASRILDAAAAGTLTEQALVTLITKATSASAITDYRALLATQADRKFLVRFHEVLDAGAADAILDGLRPAFTDAADRLATVRESLDLNTSDAELVANGTPEQIDGWRTVPTILRTLDRIGNLACQFGMFGTFALIDDPRDKDVMLRAGTFGVIRDEAVLCTTGDIITGSQSFQRPHPIGDVRSSPWLRVAPVLHTIAEARERVRLLGESAWAAMDANRSKTGTMTEDRGIVYDVHRNPFAKPELAEAKG